MSKTLDKKEVVLNFLHQTFNPSISYRGEMAYVSFKPRNMSSEFVYAIHVDETDENYAFFCSLEDWIYKLEKEDNDVEA